MKNIETWREAIEKLVIEAGKYVVKSDASIDPKVVFQTLATHLLNQANLLSCPTPTRKLRRILWEINTASKEVSINQPFYYNKKLSDLIEIYFYLLDISQAPVTKVHITVPKRQVVRL